MKIKDDNNIMKWWIINDSWLNIINDDEMIIIMMNEYIMIININILDNK